MAVVSWKSKYLFICAPGTGCTSASKALLEQTDGAWLPETDVRDEKGKTLVSYKHSTVKDLLSLNCVSEDDLNQLYVFATVRNPFDVWVSDWFRYRRWIKLLEDPGSWVSRNDKARERVRMANELTFPDYIRHLWGDQRDKPREHNAKYVAGVRHFIRNENLEEELNEALRDAGHTTPVTLEKVNVSVRDRDFRNFYDEETQGIIYDVFRPTFDRFGYTFERLESSHPRT